jgi:hypothetical protein
MSKVSSGASRPAQTHIEVHIEETTWVNVGQALSVEGTADIYRATTFLSSPRPIPTLEWKVLTTRTHLLSDLQPVSLAPELELSLNESLSLSCFFPIIDFVCRISVFFPLSCF